ncbi:RNA helicase [Aphelenchoides fujianensis]|nr:RNA helicase [Aphelenchoides fujianensis]
MPAPQKASSSTDKFAVTSEMFQDGAPEGAVRPVRQQNAAQEPTPLLSNPEKRRLERRALRGKSQKSEITAEEMATEYDVIPMGEHYDLVRAHEEDSVKYENIKEEDKLKPLNKFAEVFSGALLATVQKRFEKGPTAVQKHVIPYILQSKRDINCRSPTGSGKSGTYLLPLIHMIHERKLAVDPDAANKINSTQPYAVVFCPTRELALQLAKDAMRLAKGTCVRVAFCVGDMEISKNMQVIRNGADILIGTAGRVHHFWFGSDDGKSQIYFEFHNMSYLVLDEADRLIENAEFFTLIKSFKEKMVQNAHRTFLFSATAQTERSENTVADDPLGIFVGDDESPVQNVVQKIVQIDCSVQRTTYKNVSLNQIVPVSFKKARVDYLLAYLKDMSGGREEGGYKRVPRTIVFVKNKRMSDSMAIRLIAEGYRALSINGDRPLDSRWAVVDKLRTDKIDVLVATDVLSRGVNVPEVHTVFNLHLPNQTYVSYIHRIGRTGRLGNVGRAISLFEPADDADIAPFLIKCLENCGQEVPEFLRECVAKSNSNFEAHALHFRASDVNALPPQQRVLDLDLIGSMPQFI